MFSTLADGNIGIFLPRAVHLRSPEQWHVFPSPNGALRGLTPVVGPCNSTAVELGTEAGVVVRKTLFAGICSGDDGGNGSTV